MNEKSDDKIQSFSGETDLELNYTDIESFIFSFKPIYSKVKYLKFFQEYYYLVISIHLRSSIQQRKILLDIANWKELQSWIFMRQYF